MNSTPTPDQRYELQQFVNMHAKPEVVNSNASPTARVPEDQFGGVTDLYAADRHSGTGAGSEKSPPPPAVY